MKSYNVAIIHNDIHTKLMNTESKGCIHCIPCNIPMTILLQ